MSRCAAAMVFVAAGCFPGSLGAWPTEARIRAMPLNTVRSEAASAGAGSSALRNVPTGCLADAGGPLVGCLEDGGGDPAVLAPGGAAGALVAPEGLGPTEAYAPYLDSGSPIFGPSAYGAAPVPGVWSWQILPSGLMFKSYMASNREPRMASHWAHERDQGWLWDIALGGRVGMLRFGTPDDLRPEGWQLDVEGAAFPRLSLKRDRDLVATDFRFGIPLTFRSGRWEGKLSYYHVSSHLGDEFLGTFPAARRINYVRDGVTLAVALWLFPEMRLYTEADWAFYADQETEPWHFQFGIDWCSTQPTGPLGSPFFAVNGFLREENDYGGGFTVQNGWQWRGQSGHLLRFGMHYYNGMSYQYQFFTEHEEQIGLGVWYDY